MTPWNEDSSDWQSYLCKVNQSLASVFVDLALSHAGRFAEQPKLAWLWIRLNSPGDDGLSRDEEFDSLCGFEDDLEDAIGRHGLCRYVGRITTKGRREFYFYIPADADFKKIIDQVLRKHSEYLFQLGDKIDPSWDHYFTVLYPGENGLNQIKKRNPEA